MDFLEKNLTKLLKRCKVKLLINFSSQPANKETLSFRKMLLYSLIFLYVNIDSSQMQRGSHGFLFFFHRVIIHVRK